MTEHEKAVIEAAEGYIDALYSAKFARTIGVREVEYDRKCQDAIRSSRWLTEAVGKLRESRKVGYTIDGEEVPLGPEQ